MVLDQKTKIITEEDKLRKGILKTIAAGTDMNKTKIAAFSQDVSPACEYCGHDYGTTDHIVWFAPIVTPKGVT